MIARCHLVEPVAVIGDDPGEDVNATGRALGIGLAAQPGRKVEALLQLNQVRTPRLEHGPVAAEIDLVEDVVLQLPLDRIGPRQEAAADPQRPLAEAQVEAGRLHVGLRDVESPGVDVAGPDGPLEELARQDPFGRGWRFSTGEVASGHSGLAAGTDRAKHVASWGESTRVGTARAQAVDDLGKTWTHTGVGQEGTVIHKGGARTRVDALSSWLGEWGLRRSLRPPLRRPRPPLSWQRGVDEGPTREESIRAARAERHPPVPRATPPDDIRPEASRAQGPTRCVPL